MLIFESKNSIYNFQRRSCSTGYIFWNIQVYGLLQPYTVYKRTFTVLGKYWLYLTKYIE